MSIKTRLEVIEKKVRPKPRPRPHKFLFRFGNAALSVSELKKSMRSFKFNFEDPAFIMPKTQDQAAKQDPQPDQEPDDDELEREIEKLEQKKAALLDKGKKT